MADGAERTLSIETLRRLDRERVRLDLTDAELEALLPLLRDLLGEVDRVRPADRAGAEPEFLVAPEGWAP